MISALGLTQEQAEIVWADMVTGRVTRDYGASLSNAMKFLSSYDCDRSGRELYVCIDKPDHYNYWTLAVDLWTGEYFLTKA